MGWPIRPIPSPGLCYSYVIERFNCYYWYSILEVFCFLSKWNMNMVLKDSTIQKSIFREESLPLFLLFHFHSLPNHTHLFPSHPLYVTISFVSGLSNQYFFFINKYFIICLSFFMEGTILQAVIYTLPFSHYVRGTTLYQLIEIIIHFCLVLWGWHFLQKNERKWYDSLFKFYSSWTNIS